jgi:hypothetical protein
VEVMLTEREYGQFVQAVMGFSSYLIGDDYHISSKSVLELLAKYVDPQPTLVWSNKNSTVNVNFPKDAE